MRLQNTVVRPLLALAPILVGTSMAVAQCQPQWLSGYTHATSPLNGNIPALCRWQPPAGPAVLAVSSSFPVAGISPVPLAVWDGQAWTPLPPGPRIRPAAMAVYNDELVVGGFANTVQGAMAFIAQWDGTAWQALGSGVDNPVRALAVHDGSLYAGGEFNVAGGVAVARIARWDGAQWHDVMGGIAGPFFSMVFELHSAGAQGLIVGGFFAEAGGVPAQHIVRFDGTSWSAMGAGRPGRVEAITTFRGDIIAGGQAPAGQSTIARWDGAQWQPMGAGVNQTVRALVVHQDELIAGGFFTSAGGQPASRIARWDGKEWHAMGSGISSVSFGSGHVEALVEFGGQIVAGGYFDLAGGQPSVNFARWGCPLPVCYANCDGSTAEPILNVADFGCFLQKFAAGEPYANCDESTIEPVLNVADFSCFLQAFAGGCR